MARPLLGKIKSFGASFSESRRGPENVFDLSLLPTDVAESLKLFDTDGDGRISSLELHKAAVLLRETKTKVSRLKTVFAILVVCLFVQSGAIYGLAYLVTSIVKDTVVGGDSVLRIKNGDQVVSAGRAVDITSSPGRLTTFPEAVTFTASGLEVSIPVDGVVQLPDRGTVLMTEVESFLVSGNNIRPLGSGVDDYVSQIMASSSSSAVSASRWGAQIYSSLPVYQDA